MSQQKKPTMHYSGGLKENTRDGKSLGLMMSAMHN
jgi:hypothetical protein